jgi:hypothetical protein
VLSALSLAVAGLLLIPNAYERAAWKFQQFFAQVRRTVYAQPEALPTPVVMSTLAPEVLAPVTTASAPPPDAADPVVSVAPAPVITPLPSHIELSGITHTWQKVNNCGPATLAMGLSYWGWKGTQANTATALKPDPDDRNVSPDEMAAYARSVGLSTEVRVGGTITRLKQFIVAGLPVIVEKGILIEGAGWEGHYILVSGFSDATGNFTTQDSLQGPNFQVPYELLKNSWRAFNYTYLVLYPPARQADVQAILGADAVVHTNYRNAAQIAQQEIPLLAGQELAFAWFNLGTNLTALGESPEAASAFDQARVAELPWRMLWYQFGPYEAYYTVGRYQEVIVLAEATLAQASNLEESYYWRGRARQALGEQDGAAADWRQALAYNRNYDAPRQALAELGLAP